jgi:hypothetical protein
MFSAPILHYSKGASVTDQMPSSSYATANKIETRANIFDALCQVFIKNAGAFTHIKNFIYGY